MSWKGILRDVIIIWILTFVSDYLIGMAGGEGESKQTALLLSSFVFSIVGFVIAGCITKVNRLEHLFCVAVAFWLTGLVDVLLGFTGFLIWLLNIAFVLIMAAIGGGLSFVIVRYRLLD